MSDNNFVSGANEGSGDIFQNNHDIIGIPAILQAQNNEVEKKKVSSIENTKYYRFITVRAKN